MNMLLITFVRSNFYFAGVDLFPTFVLKYSR